LPAENVIREDAAMQLVAALQSRKLSGECLPNCNSTCAFANTITAQQKPTAATFQILKEYQYITIKKSHTGALCSMMKNV